MLALPREAAAGPERAVLLVLAEATNTSGEWCWPSVPTIAADAAIDESTARRALHNLADRKVIEVEERSGKANRYRLNLPSDDYPFRPEARTNPSRSARGRRVADPSRSARDPSRSARDPSRSAPRTVKNRNEPEAAAKRAIEIALEETDRRIAAGERIRNRRKFAETIAGDFIDQAELEVAHTDCPICRGSGVVEGYSPGAGTYRTPCPGVQP